MRHVVVRRTALLLGVLLLSCAGLFAWLVSPGNSGVPSPVAAPLPPPPDAEGLFRTRCGACHAVSSLRLDRPRSDLESFLLTHGNASDTEDRAILDFLASQRESGAGNR